jgi:hypothetical protein
VLVKHYSPYVADLGSTDSLPGNKDKERRKERKRKKKEEQHTHLKFW